MCCASFGKSDKKYVYTAYDYSHAAKIVIQKTSTETSPYRAEQTTG
jgi:hypothetical protein